MKVNTRALAVLTLLLLLLLPTPLSNIARAAARSIRHDHASSVSRKAKGSPSRVPRDLQADKRNPQKLVESSFRRIPPSTANPIGNNEICFVAAGSTLFFASQPLPPPPKRPKDEKGLTGRETTALHVCLETIDETLDELHQAVEDLHEYPNKKPLDMWMILRPAMTNQETCLGDFSHENADKVIRKALIDGEKYVEKMCSNALAMIKNMIDTNIANEKLMKRLNRKLEGKENGIGWPEWLSEGDRHKLRLSELTPMWLLLRMVAETMKRWPKHRSVAAEDMSLESKLASILYRENGEVPKKKTNIMFVRDGRTRTIVTGIDFMIGATSDLQPIRTASHHISAGPGRNIHGL
ncbi:hypothetical protein V6N12_029583 [Hibiscus sabdariffa]|uniref:Pectinesterase inhibitor domain-containing protein n=1 Tax=Hibiscus sabdariffa TaxID=183260 RepID=A0ABR2CWK2_9ROSI